MDDQRKHEAAIKTLENRSDWLRTLEADCRREVEAWERIGDPDKVEQFERQADLFDMEAAAIENSTDALKLLDGVLDLGED